MECGILLLVIVVAVVLVAVVAAQQKTSALAQPAQAAQTSLLAPPPQPRTAPAPPARPRSQTAGAAAPARRSVEAAGNSAVSFRITVSGPGYSDPYGQPPPRPEDGDRHWVPAGQEVQVKGRSLPGGMVYVGSGLRAITPWRGAEPALIDPSLSVSRQDPDRRGSLLSYWPFYAAIPAPCRAAYLDWLAGGRRDPDIAIGYVFLFFYGLERRVLFDTFGSERGRGERDLLAGEVERLLGLYGGNRSFRSYGQSFLEVVQLLDRIPAVEELSPPQETPYGILPHSLRLALGSFAAAGDPVPVEWALPWFLSWPEARLRTPAQRCAEEFRLLFKIRYQQKFKGGGLKLKPGKARLAVSYHPASGGFGRLISVPLPREIPDVSEQAPPRRKLQEIADQVCQELDAYSRWVGRTEDTDSPAALALLPPELARDREGEGVRRFREWIETSLGDRGSGLVAAAELTRHWPCQTPGKLARREAEALARFLASRGFGMEPDPRFGGPPPGGSGAARLVLFRLPPDAPAADEATPEYQAASLLLHLAAAVSAVDGAVTAEEERHLAEHLERALHLGEAERRRLEAHLRWLLAEPPGLGGLKKRIEPLAEAQRRSVGQFLITVAGADGSVGAEELKILTKVYSLLGLDAQSVYSDVHALASAAQPPAADAVTVRPAAAGPAGYALPPPGEPAAPRAGVSLDLRKVREKLAETERVASLLGDIFRDEEEAPAARVPAAAPPEVAGEAAGGAPALPAIPGLDAAHSALLRQLAAQPSWPRLEVERLAGALGLLPEGALEVINEAAFERSGSPLLEGDEIIEIDTTVLEEILA